ncbi:MAG TPA: DoxX family protein [Solirubrobacterales bacterium]|nr:DoxX family protein [Solirubrobacterales bacterium]
MVAATVISSIVLASLLAFAALRKLSHRPEVVREYRRVGVPERRLDRLAAILLAGAAGLLGGLAWAPLGLAAAAGVVVYFLLAIAAHFRFGDLAHVATPVAIELLAVATLALRAVT